MSSARSIGPRGVSAVAQLRGRRVRGDEVRRILLGVLAGEVVGGDEEVADRDDAPVERDLVADRGKARRLERLDGRAAERLRELRGRYRLLEEERAKDGAEPRVRQPPHADRNVVARQPVRILAE